MNLGSKHSLSDVPFGYLIFRSILPKTKRLGKQQQGSIIQTYLITLICQRVGVPPHLDDVFPLSTKDLDKDLMQLNDVMCVIIHGEPRTLPLPNVSQA